MPCTPGVTHSPDHCRHPLSPGDLCQTPACPSEGLTCGDWGKALPLRICRIPGSECGNMGFGGVTGSVDMMSRAAAGKARKLSELTALNVGHCGMPRCQNPGALRRKSEPTVLRRFRHVRLCTQPPAPFPSRAQRSHPPRLCVVGPSTLRSCVLVAFCRGRTRVNLADARG